MPVIPTMSNADSQSIEAAARALGKVEIKLAILRWRAGHGEAIQPFSFHSLEEQRGGAVIRLLKTLGMLKEYDDYIANATTPTT